jgi:hypothetical protein
VNANPEREVVIREPGITAKLNIICCCCKRSCVFAETAFIDHLIMSICEDCAPHSTLQCETPCPMKQ